MTWMIVIVIAAGTFLIRASMLVISSGRLPRPVAARVAVVAPAALGAMLLSAASHDFDIAVVGAVAVAFVVVRRTGNVTHALMTGFPVLWLLSALTS